MGSSFVNFVTRPAIAVTALAVGAFLVLTWALRGTPLGQTIADESEGEGRPAPGRRDRAVAVSVAGLVLVAIGAFVAIQYGVLWSIPVFVVGYGMVAVTIKSNLAYRHDSPTLRRVVRVSDTAMTASLIAGVLVIGNVLAFKYGERPFDLTQEKVYSLASLSTQQVKALQRPVKFTVFLGRTPRAQRQLQRILQLLDLYKALSPSKISVDVLYAYDEVSRFEDLARRAPDVRVARGGGVVIEYGVGETAERTVVRNTEMFDQTQGNAFDPDPAKVQTSFHGEDVVTSALIRLQEGKKPKIGFTTGHGELSLHESSPAKEGLGVLRDRLMAIGAELQVQNLAKESVPPDIAVLIVANPTTEFSAVEGERMKKYLASGGHLILFLDGRYATGLRDWLKSEFRVELGFDPVVDPSYNVRGPSLIIAPIVGVSHHSIVEPLQNRGAVMPAATYLSVVDPRAPAANGAGPSPYVAEVILSSSPESWAESDLTQPPQRDRAKDKVGPLAVGVAISEQPKPGAPRSLEENGRVVIFSSPAMASNRFLASDFANLDVVINSVNWLRGRVNLQGISPKTHTALRLAVDPNLRGRLVTIPTLMSMGFILFLGAWTYYTRRS
jgi:hypothetical protein